MPAMNTADYQNVFEETINYTTGTLYGDATWFAFIGVAILIGMWFLSGMPGWGLLKVSTKAHNIFVWSGLSVASGLAVIGAIMGIVTTVEGVNEVNKLRDVQTSMEENVAKKYDATLAVSLGDIPLAEDRDKPNGYTLVFNDEDQEKRVIQRYEIRFDRETSEPFISELQAPTANQLEAAAK